MHQTAKNPPQSKSLRNFKILSRIFKNRLLLVTVVLPTIVAGVYFGFVASDVYISESRFVVRSPEKETASPLGLILKGAGFTKAEDEAYAVQDFIASRDALKVLDDELHIRSKFSARSIDPLSRFGALDRDESLESLHLYYQRKIGVDLDSASSIITLTTRAFSGTDAYEINRRLLDLADDRINKLNEQARHDMIVYAADEVAEAQHKAKVAGIALAGFRNAESVIDPEKQSAIPLQQIAKLQDELVATRSQILTVSKIAQDNPQLPVLRRQEQLLSSEIANELKRVAGAGTQSLAGKVTEYQRLSLEKEFAEKMLASALTTLQEARNESVRKQLYLERIVQPSIPDVAMEPKRIRSILATFAVGVALFGIGTMLLAGVREHLD